MRRFQFRLERFLQLRRWKEREWELVLARVAGECLILQRRIEEITVQIGESRLAVFVEGTVIDVESMARRELYVQRLTAERTRTRERLEERRRELEKVRAKYLEASKARKVLDKLKERRSTDYYERQVDEDYRTVDDMNSSAAAARMARAHLPAGTAGAAEGGDRG